MLQSSTMSTRNLREQADHERFVFFTREAVGRIVKYRVYEEFTSRLVATYIHLDVPAYLMCRSNLDPMRIRAADFQMIMRFMPAGRIYVIYEGISGGRVINIPTSCSTIEKGNIVMDLHKLSKETQLGSEPSIVTTNAAVSSLLGLDANSSNKDAILKKNITIAPKPAKDLDSLSPDLSFVEIKQVADVLQSHATSVWLFDVTQRDSNESRLLEMLVSYSDLFDVNVMVLTGLPNADYNMRFCQATSMFDRVSYKELVENIALEKGAIATQEMMNKGLYGKEQRQITRADGTKKDNIVTQAKPGDEDIDGIAGDE